MCYVITYYSVQGNIEGARIYANNAIREKTQSLNFLKLASRIDAVSSRLETAVRMQQVNAAMGQTVKGMSNAMKSMDADQITRTMEQFEKNFEDMEVRSGVMNDTMDKSSTMTTPPEEVDFLLQRLADEAGLQIAGQLDSAGPVGSKVPGTQQAETIDENDLESRLKALRNA